MSQSKFGLAFEIANIYHFEQKRKWNGEPYICHPVRVTHRICEHYHLDDDMQCAALLHDTLEDTKYTEQLMRKDFGDAITDLVLELTQPSSLMPENTPRKEKRAADFAHMRTISDKAKAIKMADRIDNLRNIDKTPYNYARKYLDESKTLLDICKGANTDLAQLLESVIIDKGNQIDRIHD